MYCSNKEININVVKSVKRVVNGVFTSNFSQQLVVSPLAGLRPLVWCWRTVVGLSPNGVVQHTTLVKIMTLLTIEHLPPNNHTRAQGQEK